MILARLGNSRVERGPALTLSVTKHKGRLSSFILTFRIRRTGFFVRFEWLPRVAVLYKRWKYNGGT
jgi:hypothetical protein